MLYRKKSCFILCIRVDLQKKTGAPDQIRTESNSVSFQFSPNWKQWIVCIIPQPGSEDQAKAEKKKKLKIIKIEPEEIQAPGFGLNLGHCEYRLPVYL